MTTQELIDLVAGYRYANGEKIHLDDGEIRYGGFLAQMEICKQLKLLEGTARVALVAGQEKYYFPKHSVIAITSPNVFDAIAHPFNTGDQIFISGTSFVNGAIRYTVTKLTADTFSLAGYSLSGSPRTEVVTAYAHHALEAAIQFTDEGIRKLQASDASILSGTLHKRPRGKIEIYRSQFNTPPAGVNQPLNVTVESARVFNFYEIMTTPITFGVQGIPASNILCEATFYRKPILTEKLTATVDPIIPDGYDTLLTVGTIYHAMNLKPEKAAENAAKLFYEKFQMEMNKAKRVHGGETRSQQSSYSSTSWGNP